MLYTRSGVPTVKDRQGLSHSWCPTGHSQGGPVPSRPDVDWDFPEKTQTYTRNSVPLKNQSPHSLGTPNVKTLLGRPTWSLLPGALRSHLRPSVQKSDSVLTPPPPTTLPNLPSSPSSLPNFRGTLLSDPFEPLLNRCPIHSLPFPTYGILKEPVNLRTRSKETLVKVTLRTSHEEETVT